MATREQLLAWGIRKTQKISLADDLELTIRQLNGTEIEEAKKEAKAISGATEGDALVVALCAAIICRSAINPEDKSRIFQNEDARTLAEEFSYERLNSLVNPVFKLNGILASEEEDVKKNSEQTPTTSLAIN
jgi:hypothetical protein